VHDELAVEPSATPEARAAALATVLDGIPGSYARIYLAPAARVMFMSLNKNACTSLKWMMAGLAGEDLRSFRPRLMPFATHEESVHDRNLWKVSPRFKSLSPSEQAAIHPDNGWFVFAVVRDPRVRVFSAWQNKLLLENPGYTQWRSEAWYPRHPLSDESVVEDFERFVTFFERDPTHRLRAGDPHFRDQVEMLGLGTVPYTRIYEIHELRQLRADLEAHLNASGWSGELHLPRFNDTPLRPNAAPFANGVRERVERIYEADFAVFGDKWDFAEIEAVPAWTSEALAEAETRASFGRRIGDLRNLAIKHRTRAETQTKRVADLEEQVARLRRREHAAGREQDVLGKRQPHHHGVTLADVRRRLGRWRRRLASSRPLSETRSGAETPPRPPGRRGRS